MFSQLQTNIQLINQNLDILKENYNVKKIGIFGSFAKGKQTKKSDIDIVVEFKKPIGFFQFIKLEDFYSKIKKLKIKNTSKFNYLSFIKYLTKEITPTYIGYYVGQIRKEKNNPMSIKTML